MPNVSPKITVRRSLLAFAIALVLLTGSSAIFTPSFSSVIERATGSDRVLLGKSGEVVQTLRTDFNKRRLAWLPLEAFPESIQKAVVDAEDQRFHVHPGIDPVGFTRAIWTNLRGKRVQGASTITMQVTDLVDKKVLVQNRPIEKGSYLHKFAQTWRAIGLELRWSKAEILEAYLNLIHLRGEFQGVPAVSHAYLKKDPLALDPAESYVIAAMISSPNQAATSLKARACALMKNPCAATDAAVDTFVRAQPKLPTNLGFAPHIARRLFQENPGASVLRSSIDGRLQRDVVGILDKNLRRLQGMNVQDSAAIVIDNKTGQVLAYVGAVETSASPHVDGAQAYRQAGSALKPFIYAKAIDMKLLTAASVLLDDPTAISWGNDVYRPTNYDRQFNGPVSVREALASSLNVPAVKAVTIIGLHQTYQVLQNLHFSGLREPDFYGVSMALGAVDVRLDELANAYRSFANGGQWTPLQFTEKPVNKKPEQLYSVDAAYVVSSILSDPNARSIGFGWDSPLETPFWTAVKTGTSKDYRDNWCVGFSERYTVAVWAGNFDSQRMQKVSGVSGVGPSWYEIMVRLHGSATNDGPPKRPEGIVAKEVRHPWSTHAHTDYFLRGTEPMNSLIEPVLDKNAQFVFPAEGSILVRDPHADPENLALFIRFKGTVPAKSRLLWDGKDLGEAVSPFKLAKFEVGAHELAIATADGQTLTRVKFRVRGAN